MKRFIPLLPWLVCTGVIALCGAAAAQDTAEGEPIPPLPPGASPPQLPELSLPDVTDLRLAVPRPIRAATAALGMGRARLALVVGIPTVDGKPVADAASRDAAAVAAALRAGGFVVMARDDLDAQGLRDNLREFRERLQPGAIGFVYIAALGAQVDGQNLLLARDAVLPADADSADPAALAAALQRQGVPLSEVIDAVMGIPESPRLLVVDAAHAHPVLARLPQQGLAEPRLPPGTMALLSALPGAVQEVAAAAPLPSPEPVDPREIAATVFARTLTQALLNPRASGPQVLRSTRHALFDGSAGRINAWVGGETEDREELAEAQFLDLLPRTPEEAAREAARQLARQALRGGSGGAGASAAAAAGDMPVSEVLASQGPRPGSDALRGGEAMAEAGRRASPNPDNAQLPGSDALGGAGQVAPGAGAAAGAGGAGATLASVAGAVGAVGAVGAAVGSAAGSAAGAAATAAGAAVTAAVVGSVATGAATTVAGAAGSAAAHAAALGARLLSSGAAEGEAARAVAQVASGSAAGSGAASSAASAATAAAVAAVPVPVPASVAVPGSASVPAGAAASMPGSVAPVAPSIAGATAAGPAAAVAGPAGGVPAAAAGAAGAQVVVPGAGDLPVELFAARPPAAPLAAAGAAPAAAAAVSQALPAAEGAGRPAPSAPPVRVPRVNPHGYTEGDTFTYQVRDTWRDEITSTYVHSVESVTPDGSMVGNGAQVEMDPEGRLRSVRNPDGSVSVFEPAQELWWSRPERGQTRRVKFRENYARGDSSGTIFWEGMSDVGRARMVRTPAGEFEALPIRTTGWFSDRPSRGSLREGSWTRTVWYATQLGHPVAIDIRDVDRVGKLLRSERVELLNAQSSRTQP